MKRTAFLFIALMLSMIAIAQNKETRNVDNFSGISFGVAGDLYLVQGSTYNVTIEGDRDLLSEIETYERNGVLFIRKKDWKRSMNKRVTVWVTMPDIESLSVSGSGTLTAEGAVKSGEIELNVSGSGRILLSNLAADEVDSSISGSGNIEIAGSGADECDLSISGSGKFYGKDFKVGEMVISVSGSGNCECNVVKELEASVSGSGDIYYLGSPSVDVRISGSGKVRKL